MTVVTSRMIHDLLIRHVDSGELPGFCAVISTRGHQTVACGGYSDLELKKTITPDSLFRIASLTKPLGAILTLQAYERNELDLNTPVTDLIPELSSPRVLTNPKASFQTSIDSATTVHYTTDTEPLVRPITIQDLLTMTSGYGYWKGTGLANAYQVAGIASGVQYQLSEDNFLARLSQLPLCFQPGTGWAYNWSIDVLGIALQRATGQSLHTLLEERIRRPLQLTSGSYTMNSAAHATCLYQASPRGPILEDPREGDYQRLPTYTPLRTGVVMSAPDYIRVIDDLISTNPVLLSPASARMMRTPALNDVQLNQGFTESHANFGMCVQVSDGKGTFPSGTFGWGGITGVKAYGHPASGTSIALFTQLATNTDRPQPWFRDLWNLVFPEQRSL